MTSVTHDTAFVQEFPALATSLVGQFHVQRELGRGGMGVVFLARDERLDRLVALKVLPPPLAAQPVTRERFLREARTAARLSHPNVVPIYRAKGAAVALSATVLGPATAVGLAAMGASLYIYRRAYPSMVEKARSEILGALEAVTAAVQSEEVFGTLPGPGRPQRGPVGGDGSAGAAVILG